ncbi:hypothetical protein TNCV_518131 [Trichonephila clavipes]|nr:hypothetical protein TNCV_518131 [Trichonephila clavipes]
MVIKGAMLQGRHAETIQYKTRKFQPVCYRTLHDIQYRLSERLLSGASKFRTSFFSGPEIETSIQEESDAVDDETDEDEDNNNNENNKGPSNADAFFTLETAMEWYELQSAVLLNYCCSRESETLQRKNKGVQ